MWWWIWMPLKYVWWWIWMPLRCDLHSSCRLYMCVSAIVLLDLFAGFGNLPVQGKCCRFFWHACLFFTEKILVFLATRVCLHRVASPLHQPATAPLAWFHRHPRYNLNFRIMVVDHVTQLGVSRSKVASPLHQPATAPLAWFHRHPRYNLNFRIMVVDHVTQLGVSRSKVIRCRYADLCISTNVSVSNCPRFLDSPRLRRWC